MVSRVHEPVVKRPSLPLTAQDSARFDALREHVEYLEAISHLSDTLLEPGAQVSDSVLLRAVFQAGLNAIRAEAERQGYAQLAAEVTEHERTEHRAAARRRRPSWADEP